MSTLDSGAAFAKPEVMWPSEPVDVYTIVAEPFALWAFIRESESAPPSSDAPATWRPGVSQIDAERPTLVDIPRRCSSPT